MKRIVSGILVLTSIICMTAAAADERPNILWLVQEDTSPWMGCYGYDANKGQTPVIDKLAKEGVLFQRAFVPVPVCSPCRSSFIVGAHGFRFGGHEHRSRRGEAGRALPEGMRTLPELFKEAGYHTFNFGKTDYNFVHGLIYDRTKGNWYDSPKGRPFFGQIQLKGGKTNTKKWPAERMADRSSAVVPGDYPQNEMYREIIAQHCDAIRSDDDRIGSILAELEERGLKDNTIVVYFSDHGANHLVRHKQMPTEAGLHVPLIIQGPRKWVPNGQVRNDLVSILDVSATSLSWAGIPHPEWIEGQDLFAENFEPREFVGSARDRCDHTIDRIRTIRTSRYRYTRNFKLDRVFLQPQYRDGRDYLKSLREAYANNTLSPKLTEIYFGERQAEELYDIKKDPAQLNNLVGSRGHKAALAQHRKLMDDWLAKGDLGADDEPDVELTMNGNRRFPGVNPEYERVRDDSDGDGLSDLWEKYNGRDPNDGRLQFQFNCGGWQTEGWTAKHIDNNIAGYQGYLDFTLNKGTGTLERTGFNVDGTYKDKALAIKLRSAKPLKLDVLANNASVGEAELAGGEAFETVRIPLVENEAWSGTVNSLALDLTAKPGTFVEIDAIEVVR